MIQIEKIMTGMNAVKSILILFQNICKAQNNLIENTMT